MVFLTKRINYLLDKFYVFGDCIERHLHESSTAFFLAGENRKVITTRITVLL